VFECDNPGITASRHAEGDIEYLFAVNATPDENRPSAWNAFRGAQATISVPADGRPMYDAVLGRAADEFRKDGKVQTARLRFGPGQLRAFARTARPIGGVGVAAPAISCDFAREHLPIRLEIGATLLDDRGGVLAGSAPMHVRVIDPLGAMRYELYRATKLGRFSEMLTLAANDPAGQWRVAVRELLSGTEGSAEFAYQPPSACGALDARDE